MMLKETLTVVFIGAGNLATNLAKALHKQRSIRILQVYSRTEVAAKLLADSLSVSYTTSLQAVVNTADIYIIALKDSAFESLLPQIVQGKQQALLLHTAGSVPMDVWKGYAQRYGVIYPMQTFSKQCEADFSMIPFFLEAVQPTDLDLLKQVTGSISQKVYEATSEQRRYLHLSAVFACNFTNHLYTLTEQLLQKYHLPFEVMLPLIDETAHKLHVLSPKAAQTGPAVRYDENVIAKHLQMLSDEPFMQELYEKISKDIHETHQS